VSENKKKTDSKKKVKKKNHNKKIETETDCLFDKAKAIFSNRTYYDMFFLLANEINTKEEIAENIYIKPVNENKNTVGKYLTKLSKIGLVTKIKSAGKQDVYDLTIIGWIIYNEIIKNKNVMKCPSPLDEVPISILKKIPSDLIADIAKNWDKWKKIRGNNNVQMKGRNMMETAKKEILGVTERINGGSDKLVYEKIAENPDLEVWGISGEEGDCLDKIKSLGGKIMIDKDHKCIPLTVIVVDKKYAEIIFSLEYQDEQHIIGLYTEDEDQVRIAIMIFKSIWDGHPLLEEESDYTEYPFE